MAYEPKISWAVFKEEMRPHWNRFVESFTNDPGDITHAFVNLPVEGSRFDPYRVGHWVAWYVAATVVIIVGLTVCLIF